MSLCTHSKLYIDSRFAVSGTASEFVFELPEQVTCGPGTVAYITDCMLAVSWQTITANTNRIYLLEYVADESKTYARVMAFPSATYTAITVTTVLEALLNGVGSHATQPYEVTYDVEQNTTTVTNSSLSFRFLSDKELKSPVFKTAYWNTADGAQYYNVHAPGTANAVIGITADSLASPADGDELAFFNSWTSGVINVSSLNSVYLHSTTLNSNRTIAANGSRTVIRRIPVSSSFGSAIHDTLGPVLRQYPLWRTVVQATRRCTPRRPWQPH